MTKKHGLGKGLDAILPPQIADEILGEHSSKELFRQIPLDKILPNPLQPRGDFASESLNRLADSIRQQGVLQPIIVALDNDGYILVAGERRWRAAQIAKIEKIPAIVLPQKPSDEKLLFMALVENLQREDLDPIEEAEAYRMLADKFELRQEDIARQVGKSRPVVANAVRLLKLPEAILKMLKDKKLTAGHGRILLEEMDSVRQLRLARLAVRRGLSVERLMVLVSGKSKKKTRLKKKKGSKILALEDELAMALGTKVEIIPGKKKSRVVIEFYTEDELMEIAQKLAEAVSE